MDFLRRIISQRDKRSFGLELTKKGKAAIENHWKREIKMFEAILGALDNDKEQGEFVRLFKKITDKLLTE
jgi:DNA-binding MarR family transcriptional regulator